MKYLGLRGSYGEPHHSRRNQQLLLMYLLGASTWNTPTGYGGSHNVNASLHCKCEGKRCAIAS